MVPSPLTGLAELVSRPLFRSAHIVGVDDLTARVRLIDLAVPGVAPGSWRAGDKVQVRMSGMSTRTYTPIARVSTAGDGPDGFRVVGFRHGDGPGSRWVGELTVGDEAAVFGPRRSIDCSGLTGPVVVVGDETSVGLLAAVTGVVGTEVVAVFEATDPDDVVVPAERLGPSVPSVVVRAPDGAHRVELAEAVAARLAPHTTLVASGDAATVAAVRRHLSDRGVHPARTLAKAYWAEGRRGLD